VKEGYDSGRKGGSDHNMRRAQICKCAGTSEFPSRLREGNGPPTAATSVRGSAQKPVCQTLVLLP